jgi:hypothetical protein
MPGHGPIPEDPKETRQALHRFRQMPVDLRDAVQKEIDRGATKIRGVAAIKFPQYEQLQGYKSQREVAARRTYREIMGTLK